MDIQILYEDKHFVLCIKPAGIVSEEGGMPELLKAQRGGDFFCVHRLDKAAAGVMVYAKSSAAAAKLSQLIAGRALTKEYLAVVQGCPAVPDGTMRDLLFRDAGKNKSYVVKRMRRGVKEAELSYSLLSTHEGLSLVRIRLVTGRSHQIRVQFSSRGMPLVGDGRYGSLHRDCPLALWSCRLAFTHPFTGKALDLEAKPPALWPWTEFKA